MKKIVFNYQPGLAEQTIHVFEDNQEVNPIQCNMYNLCPSIVAAAPNECIFFGKGIFLKKLKQDIELYEMKNFGKNNIDITIMEVE